MPLTADQYKELIIVKVGDTGVVAANIDSIWTLHDDEATPELQYNYTLIEAIELLIGGSWQDVNWSGDGRSVSDSDKVKALISLAQRADTRIKELKSNALAIGVVVGALTTRAPIASTPIPPDANSVDYSGNPNSVWPVGSNAGGGSL